MKKKMKAKSAPKENDMEDVDVGNGFAVILFSQFFFLLFFFRALIFVLRRSHLGGGRRYTAKAQHEK
jgi:hypothetical protein